MPSPIKRKGSPFFQYDFTISGTRIRGSTQTSDIATAKAIVAKLYNDAIIGQHFPRRPRMTLNAATAKYFNEHGQYLSSAWDVIDPNIRQMIGFWGKEIYLDEITNAEISRFTASFIDKLKPATINRKLDDLSAIINRARKQWGIETAEVDVLKHKSRTPEARTRWITREEADALELAATPHLKAPIRFALLTGVRLSNITGLRWEDVDMKGRMITFRVKSNRPGRKLHELTISEPLFKLLMEQGIKKEGFVFVRHFKRGEFAPIKQFRNSFKTACKKASLKDFRFHDLRHTAASWMIQDGVPLDMVQKVLGHSNISQTQKYAHRDASELAKAMEILAGNPQIGHKIYKPQNKHNN